MIGSKEIEAEGTLDASSTCQFPYWENYGKYVEHIELQP